MLYMHMKEPTEPASPELHLLDRSSPGVEKPVTSPCWKVGMDFLRAKSGECLSPWPILSFFKRAHNE